MFGFCFRQVGIALSRRVVKVRFSFRPEVDFQYRHRFICGHFISTVSDLQASLPENW